MVSARNQLVRQYSRATTGLGEDGPDFHAAWNARTVSHGDPLGPIRTFNPPAAQSNDNVKELLARRGSNDWMGEGPNYVSGTPASKFFSPAKLAVRRAAFARAAANRRAGKPHRSFDNIVSEIEAERMCNSAACA